MFEGIFYDDYLFNFNLLNSFNVGLEINQTFYFKILHEKFLTIKKLHDNIINIRELLIEIIKFEKEIPIQHFFEIFINNIEELIFFIYKKINIKEFFLLKQWEKKDKMLLLLILYNKNDILYYINEMNKNKNKYLFYIIFGL